MLFQQQLLLLQTSCANNFELTCQFKSRPKPTAVLLPNQATNVIPLGLLPLPGLRPTSSNDEAILMEVYLFDSAHYAFIICPYIGQAMVTLLIDAWTTMLFEDFTSYTNQG